MNTGRPPIDLSLERFDADGIQTVFAISPFGNSETRAERIARWEAAGIVERGCSGCAEKLAHPRLTAFAPGHMASLRCQSGGRNHCTCDTCF